MRNAYSFAPEGKILLGRPKYRWEDSVKEYGKERGYGGGVLDLASIGHATSFYEQDNRSLGFIKGGNLLTIRAIVNLILLHIIS